MPESDLLARPISRTEALTADFYAWEARGRGGILAPYRVALEPPFEPFYRFGAPFQPIADDGRRPGLVEQLIQWVRGRSAPPEPVRWEPGNSTDDPEPAQDQTRLVELQGQLPHEIPVSPELSDRILQGLSSCSAPIAFELISTSGRITLQWTCREEDEELIRHVFAAFVPEAVLQTRPDFLASSWRSVRSPHAVITEFGLGREFMLPLAKPRSFAIDPMLGFTSALQGVRDLELAILQVMFTKTAYPWNESMTRAITDGEGGAFFADSPETWPLAKEKVSQPLFACVIRVGAVTQSMPRSRELARIVSGSFRQFTRPGSNELAVLSNEGYDDDEHVADLLERETRRCGMLLAANELGTIAHLPSDSVRLPSLRGDLRKTKAAPTDLVVGDIVLGESVHRGRSQTVRLKSATRLRHMHIVGATGSGKSTLLKQLIRQDLDAGRGFALLDPHGDLADDVLALVPDSRLGQTVVFDPGEDDAPVGLNVFSAASERERELLASDLVAVFRRFSTTWGDQMTAVLGNAILAILEHPAGGTLLDLRRFLSERPFRERMLTAVKDPVCRAFWQREFPSISGRPQTSILSRLDQFLRPKPIRRVVVQKKGLFDFSALMNSGGILIARLSGGAIGEENAHLLGSLIVAKFQQATIGREGMPESDRRDFLLYLDEFHHFITPSLTALLHGARKYHVGLVLAHQGMRQIQDAELASAVTTNAATRVCFRLGDEDARKLSEGFSSFTSTDLQNLEIGEAICRVERADHDFTIRVPPTPQVDRVVAKHRLASVRERSRSLWGTPRETLDRLLEEAFREVPEPIMETVKSKSPLPEGALSKSTAEPAPVKSPEPAPRSVGVPRIPRDVPHTAEPGRGGQNHKRLQSMIKKYAEERGFRATIEAEVAQGGRVDVLLEKEGTIIACEISVGSSTMQEVANLEKCLAGSYTSTVVVSPERKVIKRIKEAAVRKFSEAQLERVSFFTPEDLIPHLDYLTSLGKSRESTVLGYKVKTKAKRVGSAESESRRNSVIRTILNSMKRSRQPEE